MAERIQVLIIDENQEVRRALSGALRASPRIEVVATARTFPEGLKLAESLHPDLAILEPKTHDTPRSQPDAGEMVRQMAFRHSATLILTSYLVEEERTLALAAGARRYLLKDIDGAALIAAIESALYPPAPGATPAGG